MSDDLPGPVAEALARADTWEELPTGLEDRIVAAIRTEPVPIAAARQHSARKRVPVWLTIAAAVVGVVAGAAVVAMFSDDDDDREVAGDTIEADLVGTELAPEASATAQFTATPAGLKILLDAEGLPGAAPDEMYEAWIGDGEIRVSAGTFHLRQGDDAIELWAGTDDPRFHIISVTIEPIDGNPESSGQVVMRGEYQLGPAATEEALAYRD
jgi:hypothetical protein